MFPLITADTPLHCKLHWPRNSNETKEGCLKLPRQRAPGRQMVFDF